MADDIAQWLDGLGLGQYADVFAENGIELDDLPHLRDADFERLGMLLGHTRRLKASRNLHKRSSPGRQIAIESRTQAVRRPEISETSLRLEARKINFFSIFESR